MSIKQIKRWFIHEKYNIFCILSDKSFSSANICPSAKTSSPSFSIPREYKRTVTARHLTDNGYFGIGRGIGKSLGNRIFVGIFNAKKTNNPRRTESQDSDCGGYFDDINYKLRGKERARFKEMLEDLLSAVPDTLTVDEVAELTGYHRRTVLRYVQRKYIYAVNIMGKYYISKQSIINYLATR